MKPNILPGLPTIAALMTTGAIVAAISITGPIPVKYEILKDFQTSAGALIALGAAILAYKGAMARVEFEREEATRRRAIERLGVLLRFRAAATYVGTHAQHRLRDIRTATARPGLGFTELDAAPLAIDVPDEMQEAWTNLHHFPLDIINAIESLYRLVPIARDDVMRRAQSNEKYRIDFPRWMLGDFETKRPDSALKHLMGQYEWFFTASVRINRELETVIDEIRLLQ